MSADTGINQDTVNAIARAFWRRIEPFKNRFDKELPDEMPIEFQSHMATALTLLIEPFVAKNNLDRGELVNRLIEANENSSQRVLGSDIFYQAAERISFLERTLAKITNPIPAMEEEADEIGAKLNGQMAMELANDPEYLKDLARAALNV
jgi:hypothetical protein